jgi:hypothetical protein
MALRIKVLTSKMSEYMKSSSFELRPDTEDPLLFGRLMRADRRELIAETAGEGAEMPNPS